MSLRHSSRCSEPFDGVHQAGILTPAPAQATFVALDSFAPDRSTLQETLRALSAPCARTDDRRADPAARG